MPSLLILEAVGPDGERLALEAAEAADVAVGYDAQLRCATFDADELDDPQLQQAVFDALDGLDPGWRDQLRVAE